MVARVLRKIMMYYSPGHDKVLKSFNNDFNRDFG